MPNIPYRYAVALVTAIGLFMAVLNNTVVNVALVPMQEAFGIGLSQAQWIITSYFLVQAAVIPVAGYLGLWFGSKPTYLVFLGIFVVGSIACAGSTLLPDSISFPALVAARVIQGIGGGALFPLATSITFASFRPEDRASASAFISIPVLIAPTLGPAIGGVVVDSPLGWPWIFLLNVPVGLLGIALVARVLRPESRADSGARQAVADKPASRAFDWTGLLSCMAGVVAVVYAFSLVGETRDGSVTAESPLGEVNGWAYGPFWGLLLLGLSILTFFAWYEVRRAADPVLNLRLYQGRTFRVASVLTWATRGIVFGSFFLLPLFLQQYRGLSAVETGLILGAQGIGAVAGVQSAARLFDRIGPRYIVVAGFTALTASTLWLVLIDATVAYWAFIPILILRGIGFGWSNMPLQTTALAEITGPALPKATSLFNATAQVFSSIGIAITSTLFLGYVDSHADLIVQTADGFDALQAGAQGFRYAFLYLAFGTGIAAIAAFWLPRYSLKQRQAQEEAMRAELERQPSRV